MFFIQAYNRREETPHAKSDTDEQKPDMRQGKTDKVSHHNDSPSSGN